MGGLHRHLGAGSEGPARVEATCPDGRRYGGDVAAVGRRDHDCLSWVPARGSPEGPHRLGDLALLLVREPQPAVAGRGGRRRPHRLLICGDCCACVAGQQPLVAPLVRGSCGLLILAAFRSGSARASDQPVVLAAARVGGAPLLVRSLCAVRAPALLGMRGRRRLGVLRYVSASPVALAATASRSGAPPRAGRRRSVPAPTVRLSWRLAGAARPAPRLSR